MGTRVLPPTRPSAPQALPSPSALSSITSIHTHAKMASALFGHFSARTLLSRWCPPDVFPVIFATTCGLTFATLQGIHVLRSNPDINLNLNRQLPFLRVQEGEYQKWWNSSARYYDETTGL